jgi:alpha-amylase
MIQTCRSFGVRVYADAVVNHMSGGGNDAWPSHRNGNGGSCDHWSAKESTGPSPYYTHNFMYENSNNTGLRPALEFPGAGYIATDFHCERSLNSWTDPFQLNNGWLSGLSDLDTESDYVRERIAAYWTDLISIGFSGFRVDAAKHIQPSSLAAILAKFKANLGGADYPADFITYLEVLLGGEKDLLMCGSNDYNYGQNFVNFMKSAGLSDSDINKVKIWSSDYPKEFPICGYWAIPAERLAVENDCHDD